MDTKKTLVVIPARAGSKGIPGKNVKKLGNKPLIAYSIETALSLFPKEQICVTTNDPDVIRICEHYSLPVPFVRPEHLSLDTSTSQEVILHALDFYSEKGQDFETVVLLQPTSPFRKTQDVQNSLAVYQSSCDMVVSVFETSSNPYFTLMEMNNSGYLEKSKKGSFTRRQDAPKVYELNGAVYVMNAESLRHQSISEFTAIIPSIMSEDQSVDLDTLRDWEFAEFLIEKGHLNLD